MRLQEGGHVGALSNAHCFADVSQDVGDEESGRGLRDAGYGCYVDWPGGLLAGEGWCGGRLGDGEGDCIWKGKMEKDVPEQHIAAY